MKKMCFLMVAAALMSAPADATSIDTRDNDEHAGILHQIFQPIEPTYMDGVYVDEGWKSNWFVTTQAGASAFIGNPCGSDDLFGRMKPLLHLSIGKWVSPHVGVRVSYQGLQLKDADIRTRNYQSAHGDLLYNVSSHFRYDEEALPKWDCIPFVGLGVIRNSYTHQKPFAFSYGVIGRHRMGKRFHITAEMAGTTTFQNFDGHGKANAFGDNLLQLSIGVTATIGKVGWRRVIDPMPYIYQNDLMMEYINQCALRERHKIYSIQQSMEEPDTVRRQHPKNNYSGLNSLRERLRNRNRIIGEEMYQEEELTTPTMISSDSSFVDKYLSFGEQKQVGAPVFFFFRLNTAVLTEEVQIVNVETIAKVMKSHNLCAHVIGAADSQTGNKKRNQKLGKDRAEYILSLLVEKFGVDERCISLYNEGGINTYKPLTANRNACVILYVPNK